MAMPPARKRGRPAASSSSSTLNPLSRLNFENPWENPEILSRVFSHCSVESLKNCRLTGSKLWLDVSMKHWRNKAVLKIKPKPKYYSLFKALSIEDLQRIHEEKEHVYKLELKPFWNIKFERFFDIDRKEDPELEWFLEKYSKHLRHVTFAHCRFSSLGSFLDILLKLENLVELKLEDLITFNRIDDTPVPGIEPRPSPKVSNLKRLIRGCPTTPRHEPEFPWKQVFQSIPSLEELQIRAKNYHLADEARKVFRTLEEIRRENGSKMIPSKISTESTVDVPSDISDVKIPMPSRLFGEWTGDIARMKPYSATLKYLHVSFTEYRAYLTPYARGGRLDWLIDNVNDISEDKIVLPSLKEFRGNGTLSRVFENLNKMVAPSLETLKVEDVDWPAGVNSNCWNSNDMIPLDNPSFGNVSRLELFASSKYVTRYSFGAEDIKQLSRSLPNVLHVKMPLTGEGFTELCRVWPNLLTLTVVESRGGRGVGDAAIIGGQTNEAGDLVVVEGRPSIRDLKNLTDFSNPYELTDLSINFGFLHMPRLLLFKAKFSKISKEAKLSLDRNLLFGYSITTGGLEPK